MLGRNGAIWSLGAWGGVVGGVGGSGGWVFAAVAGVVVGGAGFQPAALAQGGPLGNLRAQYPEARVYEAGERVRTVYGTPMTAGQTPREAAEAWVGEHGAVFGGPWLELDEFREARLRRAPEGKERRVFMYRQEMDGLPVVGSSFRVMTLGEPGGVGGGGPARVVYAAGRVAIRPEGGLPQPTVTPGQALEAAKAHHKGREMVRWSEPELVAIYDDAPRGDAVAYPAWRMFAGGGTVPESYTFYVHAVAGGVARYHSNVMHASAGVSRSRAGARPAVRLSSGVRTGSVRYLSNNTIKGTVTGWATPAVGPDQLGPDTVIPATQNCPNDPDEFPLRDVRVVAYLAGMQTFVADAWTDANGDYELGVPASTELDVHAQLEGPGWFVLDGTSQQWGEPLDPLVRTGIFSGAAGVDFEFNETPSEAGTAFVNAHMQMSRTWRTLGLEHLDPIPDAPVIVHRPGTQCNAFFWPPGGDPDWPWEQGALMFVQSLPSCANSAYSTFIAHEYGHFVLWHLTGIEVIGMGDMFHEGFADAVAHMVFNTRIFGQDFWGCGNHTRDPLGADPSYPHCPDGSCLGAHCLGQLLSALWLDMRNAIGIEAARGLFLDWLPIAQRPGTGPCLIGGQQYEFPQAADSGTLVEVLSVAPDAYVETICEVFQAGRNIGVGHPSCPDSAGGRAYADCDNNGVLDFWDFLCFQNAFIAGDPYADCDGDGWHSFFDFLCFQNEFLANSR